MTKPLVDATHPLRVVIVPDDLVGAQQSDPHRCVIARAVHRRRGVIDQRVGARMVRLEYADRVVRYELAGNDRALIAGFDTTGAAFAAGYTVTLLPPRRALGARSGERPGTNRRSGKGNVVGPRRDSTRNIFVSRPEEHP